MGIGWLSTGEGFKKVEILDETPAFRRLKLDNKVVIISGAHFPHEGRFPALYYGDSKPRVFDFEGRSLPKVNSKDFHNAMQAQALIPDVEPYHFPIEETLQVLDGIINGDHILLCGPTGTGKTSRVLQIAARIGQPVIRINFSAQVSPSDLLGFLGIGAGGTVWHDGLLTTAMEQGYWLLLDELDFCPPDVGSVLFPVLENVSRVVLKEHPQGKVVTGERHKPWSESRRTGFRVFATGNSFGGEPGGYHGTQPQNKALLNRFSGHGRVVEIKGMSPKDEKAVLQERCPWMPAKLVRRAVKFASKVRKSDGQHAAILPDFSTRELLNWCEKTVQYRDPVLAANLTFLPLAGDDGTRGALRDAIVAIVGRRVIAGDRKQGLNGFACAREHAAPMDPANQEAAFVSALEAREKGLSWEGVEKALGLPNRNGMSAWELVLHPPEALRTKYADRIKGARGRSKKKPLS